MHHHSCTTAAALPLLHYRFIAIAALPLLLHYRCIVTAAAITLLRYHHCYTQKMKVSAQKTVGAGWDESDSESGMG